MDGWVNYFASLTNERRDSLAVSHGGFSPGLLYSSQLMLPRRKSVRVQIFLSGWLVDLEHLDASLAFLFVQVAWDFGRRVARDSA